jgi:hypothetical protein
MRAACVVRRGLEPNDRIIINGLMSARPGATVTPQPGTIEAPSATAAAQPQPTQG